MRRASTAAAVAAVAVAALLPRLAAPQPQPPDLDVLASVLQPAGGANQAVYGAPSVSNAWASVLASSSNVLGFNALEAAPFSSGWDSQNLYGWSVDTASLSVDGAFVQPNATLWTPYSVLRTGVAAAGAGPLQVSTEMRFVFEAQALLLEANVSLASGGDAASFALGVDLRAPLRYFPRADLCSSWHYPTHSEPCCWNWFPPEPFSGQDGAAFFSPSWHGCGGGGGSPFSAMLSLDAFSAASSAFAFPGACGGGSGASQRRERAAPTDASPPATTDLQRLRRAASPAAWTELAAPDEVDGTAATWRVVLGGANPSSVRLRLAFVFNNATDTMSTVLAARALADSFEAAWADARADWQARFNSAFDPSNSHFSGSLPLVTIAGADGGAAPAELVYYHSVISLLANERTNLPPSFPADDTNSSACLQPRAVAARRDLAAVDDAELAESFQLGEPRAAISGLERYLRPVGLGRGRAGTPRVRGCSFSGGGASADFAAGAGASQLLGRGTAVDPRALLHEDGAAWRMFLTGGGMNSTTNIFYWDYQYGSFLLALLEPETFKRQWMLWTSSVDEASDTPSQWSFWGYDYAASRGVGNYYGMNDATLGELVISCMYRAQSKRRHRPFSPPRNFLP